MADIKYVRDGNKFGYDILVQDADPEKIEKLFLLTEKMDDFIDRKISAFMSRMSKKGKVKKKSFNSF